MNKIKSLQKIKPFSFKGVLASLEKTDRILTEKFAETDRMIKQNAVEAELRFQKLEKLKDEVWQQIKENSKNIGGISNSNGNVAESYFINSFENSLKFAGQEYDSFDPNLRRKSKKMNLQAEYDLVMYNCTSVAIIEIKYKAEKDDIELLLKKPHSFKQLFPEYTNFDIYLGLAGLSIEKDAEKEAIKQGIAVIKQVGENMVINDAHLKVF